MSTNTNHAVKGRYYQLLTVIFIASLISANIIAVKIIGIFGFVVPAGIIIFPVSYIINDLLTEVYGYDAAKRAVWLGFFANAIVVLFVTVAVLLPAASFWQHTDAFTVIFSYTPRLLAASFVAYVLGSLANASVLSRLKIATHGRYLWLRTIGSTIVGEGLDSLLFVTIAFVGTTPSWAVVGMIVTQWAMKVGYETIATPLTYACVSWLKRRERIDTYDTHATYTMLPS